MNIAMAGRIEGSVAKKQGVRPEKINNKGFIKVANQVMQDEDKLLKSFFAKHGTDTSAKTNTFTLKNNQTVKVNFVSKAQQDVRRKLHNKMRRSILDTERAIFTGNSKIYDLKYCKDHPNEARDFVSFFGDRMKHPEGSLQGWQVADKLVDENVDSNTKIKLFSTYIDELYGEFERLNTPSSDEEFVEKYPKLRQICHGLMGDHIAANFEQYASVPLPDDILNKYKEYRNVAQQTNSMLNVRSMLIGDPCYCYMTPENIAKLTAEIGMEDLADCEGYTSKEIGNFPNSGMEVIATNLMTKDLTRATPSSLDLLERRGHISKSENSVYVDINGPITKEKALADFADHKTIGIIDKQNGKMKVFSINTDMNPVVEEISENVDKKQAYKNMLATLDKGTGMFIRSGELYKNMRSTLSKLIDGKGDEQQLLSSLKEDSKKYLDNFYNKTRVSNTAINRRQCVLNMVNQLSHLEKEQTLGEKMREYKAMNKELFTGPKKNQIFAEKDRLNSSGDFYKQEKSPNVKNFEKDKDVQQEIGGK